MSAAGRLLALCLGLGAMAALAGCSSSSGGISDSEIVHALSMRKVLGNYAIDGNPFCSVSKLLHDVNEVKAAGKSGRVIASHDHSIGVEIVKPFAPSCVKKAQRKLNRLANGGGQAHHGANGNKKRGGGGGG